MQTIAGADEERSRARRDVRYVQLELLNSLSTLRRLHGCLNGRASADHGVSIVRKGPRAHFRNVRTCASVHACPCCASKIRNGRAGEIEQAVTAHLAAGGGVLFATFTLPHDVGDRLAALLRAVTTAYTAMVSGAAASAERTLYGVEGSIRALEVNHGPNGWHPHHHVLFLTARPLRYKARKAFERSMWLRWRHQIVKAGYRPPSAQNGCDVRPVWGAAGIADYTAKVYDERRVGLELARSDLKSGRFTEHRSAWAVLGDLAAHGDVEDLALWWEYERATKGQRAVRWSKGLKARYGVQLVTDAAHAAEEVGGVVVAVISGELWPAVCRMRGARLGLLRMAEVDDDPEAVNEYLARIEVEAFGDSIPPGGPPIDADAQERRATEMQLAARRLGRSVVVEGLGAVADGAFGLPLCSSSAQRSPEHLLGDVPIH